MDGATIHHQTGDLHHLCHSPPQPPSFLVTTNLLSVSLYICFCFIYWLLSPHTSEIIQYLSFSVWFISLSIVPLRPIHVVTNGWISFFLWLRTIIHTHPTSYLFTHWWPLRLFSYLGYWSGTFRSHMAVLFLIFWGISILFSREAAPIYSPINSIQGFLFLHILQFLSFR